MLRLGREISVKAVTPEQFMRQAGDFVRARPEVISVSWVQADESVKAARTTLSLPLDPGQAMDMDPLGGHTEPYDPLHISKEP